MCYDGLKGGLMLMLTKKQQRFLQAEKKRTMSFLGRMAQLKGKQTEERFFRAWNPKTGKHAYEQIIESVRPGDSYEDTVLKADAILYTKLPSKPIIGIQIKSSLERAKDFIKKEYPVPVVWITPWDTARQIRRNTIFSIVNMFPFIAEQLKRLGCEPPIEKINYFQTVGNLH